MKDEFQKLCGERMAMGRIKHGDWHEGVPWEWAFWNLIEEYADIDNYFKFAFDSKNAQSKMLGIFDVFRRVHIESNEKAALEALSILNFYGNPEIVKQLKEGSYKPCPKK